MKRDLHFDARDIPSAARLGLSGRKIWAFFKASALSWAVWAAAVYLGFLAADPAGLGARWESGRLLPLPSGVFWMSWQAVGILCIGLLTIVGIQMRAFLEVARMTFEQLRGDDFYSGRDARKFSRGHWKPLAAVPAALLVALAVAVLCGAVLGLLTRIPSAGPVIFGLLAVPAWGLSLLCVLAAVALALSFFLVPAIVASTKGDTYETIFELFSTITSQPWRVALYFLLALVTRAAAMAVFLSFCSAAAGFLGWAAGMGLGRNPASALAGGLQVVAPELAGRFAVSFDVLGLAGGTDPFPGPAGAVAALAGAAIVLVSLSYWLSSCSSAWTLIYVCIRRRKDGEDLLARADEEDFREFQRLYGSADESSRGAGEAQEACGQGGEG